MVRDTDVSKAGDENGHCRFVPTILVAKIEQEESAIKGLLHCLVCRTAMEGDCTHPCFVGRWGIDASRALRSLSNKVIHTVRGPKGELVPSPRTGTILPVR